MPKRKGMTMRPDANDTISPKSKTGVTRRNLLGSAIKRYNTYRNVPNFYEYSGRSFFFGIRGRL